MPTVRNFAGEDVEYVEVHDEPVHRRQFNNEFCWIYIAGFRPGETSLWHRHSENTFYVCVENACAALNRPTDKEPFVHHASPGDVWWAMSKESPYVHQVCLLPENTHPSQFFGMEFLRVPPVISSKPLKHPCYRFRPADSRQSVARVYDFKLGPGQSTGEHVLNFCGVILCLESGGPVKAQGQETRSGKGTDDPFRDVQLSRIGGFAWIHGPVQVNARNEGDGPYQAIVVEWLAQGQSLLDDGSRL